MRLVRLFVCVVAACAAEPEFLDDEIEIDPDGKADAADELKVRTGETSVWMTRELSRRDTPDDSLFVMRGRASRNITEGMGFVIDDPYGDFAQRGARSFEVTWPVSTARTLVDGVDQFVRLSFPHSSGRPDSLTARAVVRPRFASFTGSGDIYLTAELTPIVVAGEVFYRAKGHGSSQLLALDVSINGKPHPVHQTDGTHFEIDLAPDLAFAIAGSKAPLADVAIDVELAARPINNSRVSKHARLGLSIKKLALTAGDPYAKFPRPDCPTATKTCLSALPDGALDLASCGEAFVVQSCRSKLGVTIDDVMVTQAIAQGHTVTSSAAFRSDAIGLVGAARVEQLIGGAEQTLDDRVSRTISRWLLTPTARTAVLDGAVDGSITAAYAHPLELVEPVSPVLGDLASIRAAAADALLAELAVFDFVHSEFSRSYEALVTEFRAQHVQSIREFRETNVLEPYLADRDVMVGQWLGTHVEISVSNTTGAVVNTFIEID